MLDKKLYNSHTGSNQIIIQFLVSEIKSTNFISPSPIQAHNVPLTAGSLQFHILYVFLPGNSLDNSGRYLGGGGRLRRRVEIHFSIGIHV